jgi:hypothetical protein
MSGLERWKEDGYPTGADLSGTNSQGQTPAFFLRQTAGNRSGKLVPNRKKKDRLLWIMLRVALLAAGVVVWLWVYLGPVRDPPMMSLSKPELKDHYNDIDDFTDTASRSEH